MIKCYFDNVLFSRSLFLIFLEKLWSFYTKFVYLRFYIIRDI